MASAMARVCVSLIKKGEITLNDIKNSKLRAEVKKLLEGEQNV